MDKQQLHDRLEQLDSELRKIKSVDQSEREILQRLAEDIHELLEQSETDKTHRYERLGKGLREGIEQLEASHPGVTMLMGQVIDILAKMGV